MGFRGCNRFLEMVRFDLEGNSQFSDFSQKFQLYYDALLLLQVMELNLLSLVAVRAFAKQWSDRQLPLHVLINNAGIFSIGGERCKPRKRLNFDAFSYFSQSSALAAQDSIFLELLIS